MVTWGLTRIGSPFRLRDGRRSPESGCLLLSDLDRPLTCGRGLDLLDLWSIGSSSTGAGELNLGSCAGGLGIA